MSLIKQIIPSPVHVVREGIIVLGGLIIAAAIISRFPKLQEFITGNSITVKDTSGRTLF
jgi:hypothetical protein